MQLGGEVDGIERLRLLDLQRLQFVMEDRPNCNA
jgi:hypothetical protein